jgi:RNA polymerase sigma-70 factor (ECF subfamily)
MVGASQTFSPSYLDLLDASSGGYHGADKAELHAKVMPSHLGRSAAAPLSSEDTIDLLELVKIGDRAALDRLLQRCIPPLRRWAHGRLPPAARAMHDTGDLVQETVIAALRRLEAFEARYQGALQAYLRQALMNRVRDLVRQAARRPAQVTLPDQLADPGASPLEQLIGSQNLERYEKALQRLPAADREAVIARLELQYSYDELAVVLDKPTADAARVAVTRAVKRLAREMLDA